MKKLTLIFFLICWLIAPLKVSAATVSFFTSGGGSVYPNTNINVTVYANGSDPYNAVDVTVNFSNLTYLGVSAAGGWTGVSGPNRSGNTITYSGALLGSSATGSRAVLNLSFRASSSLGSGTISASGTIALADGNGTQVSGGGNTVTYNVIAAPPPPKPAPTAPSITSTSHPSQDDWYKSNSVNLTWDKHEGILDFSYELNTAGDTNPDDVAEQAENILTLDNLPEGINYFHVRARNEVGWGDPSHFRINVDSTSPDPFKIAILDDPEDEDQYILFYATNDAASGISYFDVEIDGENLGPQPSGYKISKNTGKVLVTAFDKAGNSISDELIITPDLVPVDEEIPEDKGFQFDVRTFALTIAGLVLIGVIIGLAYLVYKRYKTQKSVKMTVSS